MIPEPQISPNFKLTIPIIFLQKLKIHNISDHLQKTAGQKNAQVRFYEGSNMAPTRRLFGCSNLLQEKRQNAC